MATAKKVVKLSNEELLKKASETLKKAIPPTDTEEMFASLEAQFESEREQKERQAMEEVPAIYRRILVLKERVTKMKPTEEDWKESSSILQWLQKGNGLFLNKEIFQKLRITLFDVRDNFMRPQENRGSNGKSLTAQIKQDSAQGKKI